jgi:TonB family protein
MGRVAALRTRIAALLLPLLFAPAATQAQTAPPPEPQAALNPQAGTPPAAVLPGAPLFPDSLEGLKSQIGAALEATQTGEKQKLAALLDGFALPDSQKWTMQTFGTDSVFNLQSSYWKMLDSFKNRFIYIAGRGVVPVNLHFTVDPAEQSILPRREFGQRDFPQPVVQVPLENYLITISADGMWTNWEFSFVYLDGAFRVIGGRYPFWIDSAHQSAGPSPFPSRIRVGGNVQGAALVRKVAPVYPQNALSAGIGGDVVLRVVVGLDGKVHDLRYISGPTELVDAAMDAVKQWAYKPTMLNKEPVEVESTVTVTFAPGLKP